MESKMGATEPNEARKGGPHWPTLTRTTDEINLTFCLHDYGANLDRYICIDQ